MPKSWNRCCLYTSPSSSRRCIDTEFITLKATAKRVHAMYTPNATHHRNCSCSFCSKFFSTSRPIVRPARAPVKWATYDTEGALGFSDAYRE